MRKGFVVALAVTGSLAVGPAALAATAQPSGALPGLYTPQHAGHDHGKKPDKPKKDDKKGNKKGDKKYSKKSYDDFDGHDHDHGGHDHWHHHHGDSAHASGGYDSHREHPRGWHWGENDND